MRRRAVFMFLLFLVSSIVLFIARSNHIRSISSCNVENKTLEGTEMADIDVVCIKLRKLLEQEKERSSPFANLEPKEFLKILNENSVNIYQVDTNNFDSSKLTHKTVKGEVINSSSTLTVDITTETGHSSVKPSTTTEMTTTTTTTTTTARPKRNLTVEMTDTKDSVKNTTPVAETLSDIWERTEDWSLSETTTTVDDFETESNHSDLDSWSVKSTTTTVTGYESDTSSDNTPILKPPQVVYREIQVVGYNESQNKSSSESLSSVIDDFKTVSNHLNDEISYAKPIRSTTASNELSHNWPIESTTVLSTSIVDSFEANPNQSDHKISYSWPIESTTADTNAITMRSNRESFEEVQNSVSNISSERTLSHSWPNESTTVSSTSVADNFQMDLTRSDDEISHSLAIPTVEIFEIQPNQSDDEISHLSRSAGSPTVAVNDDTSNKEEEEEEEEEGQKISINEITTVIDDSETNSNQSDDEVSRAWSIVSANVTQNNTEGILSGETFETKSNQSEDKIHQLVSIESTTVTVNDYIPRGHEEDKNSSSSSNSERTSVIDYSETNSNQSDDEVSSYWPIRSINTTTTVNTTGGDMVQQQNSSESTLTVENFEANLNKSDSEISRPLSVGSIDVTTTVNTTRRDIAQQQNISESILTVENFEQS